LSLQSVALEAQAALAEQAAQKVLTLAQRTETAAQAARAALERQTHMQAVLSEATRPVSLHQIPMRLIALAQALAKVALAQTVKMD
jgi:hypothetical protein